MAIPPHLMGDVEELGERCRRGLSRQGIRPNQTLEMLVKLPVFTQYFCAAIMPGLATAQLNGGEGAYPSRAADVDVDIERGSQGLIYRSAHLHHGHAWIHELSQILMTAHGDRGWGSSERTKHVIILAATPSLAGHLEVILRAQQALRGSLVFHRISSKSGPANKRNANLRLIGQRALSSRKTHVIISTANLLSTGIDTLTFCNYLVFFGELFLPYHEAQAVGRIRRQGQEFPTHVFHLRSTHGTHKLVHHRNKGRQTLLSDFGCISNGGEAEGE
ncbi:hypothetical protein V8C42DRAFT_356553 [Trichoderma barbatum]